MSHQSIGLDTLHLAIQSSEMTFSPAAVASLNGRRDLKAESDLFLLRDTSGAMLYGRNVFLNSDDGWAMEVNPSGDNPNVKFRFAAGLFSGDNSTPSDAECLRVAMSRLSGDLAVLGIGVDLLGAEVRRVDVCRNLELAYCVPAYIDCWRGAAFPAGVVPLFESGHSFRYTLSKSNNWPRQWGCYDKGLERGQKAAVGRRKLSVPHSNLMRCEYRLKGKAVSEVLGKHAVLADVIKPAGFAALVDCYHESAREKLLSVFPEPVMPASADNSLRAEMAAVREWLAFARSGSGFESDLGRCFTLFELGFDGACDLYRDRKYLPCETDTPKERKSKAAGLSREKRRLRDLWNGMQMLKNVRSGGSPAERIEEMRAAILA
jgi:hypothetical protein